MVAVTKGAASHQSRLVSRTERQQLADTSHTWHQEERGGESHAKQEREPRVGERERERHRCALTGAERDRKSPPPTIFCFSPHRRAITTISGSVERCSRPRRKPPSLAAGLRGWFSLCQRRSQRCRCADGKPAESSSESSADRRVVVTPGLALASARVLQSARVCIAAEHREIGRARRSPRA